MLSCANSGEPLTRRQMRELERAAEAEVARHAAQSLVTPASIFAEAERARSEPPQVVEPQPVRVSMGAIPSNTATIQFAPVSRRELRTPSAGGLRTAARRDRRADADRRDLRADADRRDLPAEPVHRARRTASGPHGTSAAHDTSAASAAPTTRASRREQRTEQIPWKPVRGADSRGVSRAALLGTLGAVTIAAPMTGFVGAPVPAEALAVAATAPLTQIAAESAAAHLLEGTISSASVLRKDPLARLVAEDFASRQQAQTLVNGCEASSTIAANGIAEVYTERVNVPTRPMAQGTYRDTSLFGPRWGRLHTGTDMAAPVGTPLYSVTEGTVVHSGEGRDGRSGSLVIIHSVVEGEDTWFWYGHMYERDVFVREGDQVRAGQVIAGVGNSGRSTGPHLHFEIHTAELGNAVDPLTWLDAQSAHFPGQC
nr:M23 family metallopeptidase [Actinomycetales bacterium]